MASRTRPCTSAVFSLSLHVFLGSHLVVVVGAAEHILPELSDVKWPHVCTRILEGGGRAGDPDQGTAEQACLCFMVPGAPWGLEPSPVSRIHYSSIGWCRLLVAASVLAQNASLYVVSLGIGWFGLLQGIMARFHSVERGREREKEEQEKRGGEEQGTPGRNDRLFMISPKRSCSIAPTSLSWSKQAPCLCWGSQEGNRPHCKECQVSHIMRRVHGNMYISIFGKYDLPISSMALG